MLVVGFWPDNETLAVEFHIQVAPRRLTGVEKSPEKCSFIELTRFCDT